MRQNQQLKTAAEWQNLRGMGVRNPSSNQNTGLKTAQNNMYAQYNNAYKPCECTDMMHMPFSTHKLIFIKEMCGENVSTPSFLEPAVGEMMWRLNVRDIIL